MSINLNDFLSELPQDEQQAIEIRAAQLIEEQKLLCGICGTDHTDPDDEWICVENQGLRNKIDDEPADCDDDRGMNPYDGTYDYMEPEDYDMGGDW